MLADDYMINQTIEYGAGGLRNLDVHSASTFSFCLYARFILAFFMPSTKSKVFLLTIYIYFFQKDLRKKSGLRGRRAKREVLTRLLQDENSGRRVDFVDMSNFLQEKHKKSCRIVNKTC